MPVSPLATHRMMRVESQFQRLFKAIVGRPIGERALLPNPRLRLPMINALPTAAMPSDGARVPVAARIHLTASRHFGTCALIPCIRQSPAFDGVPEFGLKTRAAIKRGSVRQPEQPPDQRTTSQIPCIIDVRAPDARVERPVSFNALQRRSKTSVTTNRSTTAVNAAISAVVRSIIDLTVARWEPEGKPIFDAKPSLN
jgi:hypothetical protein